MEFDWDNISIGEPALNTSNSYFFRDIKMEKGDEPNLDCAASSSSSGNSARIHHPDDKALLEEYQRHQAKTRQGETCDRAYRYAQVYENKRKALREKEEKQLQEMKKFHARPAPNFKSGSKKENALPKFTIPVTPKQMKPERIKKHALQVKKLEDRTKEPEPSKEFKANDAKVLKEEPFKPALVKTVIKSAPFELRMSSRLQERKQIDEQRQRAKEEKARREAEEKRLAEERELKLLRKQKEFKANPNPFK
ncbi:caldesmon [Aedes aegypti]|uniref:TPX2 C-terminal domain-containing protein n=1 Tax=Aedes aegypti TaxID=7159 RepID=A0A903UDQ5_AEDAE|nr:caldesmon [Aedes aegypti]